MSRIVDLADALAVSLTAADFSIAFTALRRFRVTFDLVDMADLKVSVVPKGVEIAAISRASNQRDIQIDVGVQRKLALSDHSEIPALLDLVEEIEQHVRDTKMGCSRAY